MYETISGCLGFKRDMCKKTQKIILNFVEQAFIYITVFSSNGQTLD